jgi:hypothetical protein
MFKYLADRVFDAAVVNVRTEDQKPGVSLWQPLGFPLQLGLWECTLL